MTVSPAHKRTKVDDTKDDEEEISETEQNHSIAITKEEPNWQSIADGLDVVSQDYLESAASTTTQSECAYIICFSLKTQKHSNVSLIQ